MKVTFSMNPIDQFLCDLDNYILKIRNKRWQNGRHRCKCHVCGQILGSTKDKWCPAFIVENNGVDVYKPNGEHIKEFKSNKKYSVVMCDYNGYFDWKILNKFGAIDGCIYCDTEFELLVACEMIGSL